MCFSPEASFIAGGTLSAMGIATVRNTRHPSELPFAMIPVLLGIQQLIEGVIWLTFHRDAPLLQQAMTYLYAGFAYVVWPIYAPFALAMLEQTRWRKRVILAFMAAGIVVGLFLLNNILSGPLTAAVVGRHIVYSAPSFTWALVPVLYLGATCVSGFFSSHAFVRMFGGLALLAAIIAYVIHVKALVSVWCFFAAVLSLLIYCHLRFRHLGGFPVDLSDREISPVVSV